ncbi:MULTISPECIES: hypothetical protein [Amycolatopsis]|uniref:hypothetical protein n=1 Tax=Amycolatopsis TaxID=1813 RepID=UPI001E53AB47|nr:MULTISPECIES: hypothetical protein [Amycolatopsis]
MLEVLGGAVAQLRAVADLGVAGAVAQLGSELLGCGNDQGLEVVDRSGARADRAGPGAHQDAEGFAVAALAGFDQVIAAEDLSGGVEGVALAPAAARRAFRPACFDDTFPLPEEECGEPGTVAAGSTAQHR